MADTPKRSRASTPVLVDEPALCASCAALRAELAEARAGLTGARSELAESRAAVAALQARRG